ncbi:MAG: hypothetical protein SRB2_02592 [Desulfobacteraceae bacterium Eth-SRB2]|nr:MAG: hypothetical protein SRB2_02592 [Desulfobacteraceae bacterium Eth-SRB2]
MSGNFTIDPDGHGHPGGTKKAVSQDRQSKENKKNPPGGPGDFVRITKVVACPSVPGTILLEGGVNLLVEFSPIKDFFVSCYKGSRVFKRRGNNHAVCGIAVKGPQLTGTKSG